MADFHLLPDDIICNIIARLPAKPLLRFRCVSKYWDRTLRDPHFMKLRARKIIFFPSIGRHAFDLIDDTSNLIIKRCHPFDLGSCNKLSVVGTVNGVVLLAWFQYFVLYNPFTGASKLLPSPPSTRHRQVRGFAYGATPDDLKIVRFIKDFDYCDVYNFREGSWSRWDMSKYNISINFEYDEGQFVNGSLYWIAYRKSVLIALNVNDMVLSEICPPFKMKRGLHLTRLGTMDGYLCSLQAINHSSFDMWVMKEEKQWSKIYSFELVGLPLSDNITYHTLCILDSRRLLMWNPFSENLLIYDTSKGSYKALNISVIFYLVWGMPTLEYVETLVSPSDMCNFSSSLQKRRKCKE